MTRVLLVLVLLTTNVVAGETVVPGVWMYKHTGLGSGVFDQPKVACTKWAEYRKTQGYTETFQKVAQDGPDSWTYSCWFVNEYGETWAQNSADGIGAVEAVYVCPIGATPFSNDNSGTRASQRCSCPDGKQCTLMPSGTSGGGSTTPKDEASPPAPEVSERCTQRAWDKTKSVAQAKRESRTNQRLASSTAERRRIKDDYKKARKKIIQEMKDKLDESADASNATPTYPVHWFPTFGPKDMCDEKGVTVTDVNIGWLCGSRAGDFAAANNIAGYGVTPPSCTWHHHEDFGRMQLVKKSAHQATSHHGGVSIWSRVFGITKYPGF